MTQSQFDSLLSDIAARSEAQLAELDADLDQAATLLAEAIEKLSASFGGMHAVWDCTISRCCESQRAFLEANQLARARLAEHVNTAVTALQVEDLINQLLRRAQARVATLRRTLRQSSSEGRASGRSSQEMLTLLQSPERDEAVVICNIPQTRLEGGTVEFF